MHRLALALAVKLVAGACGGGTSGGDGGDGTDARVEEVTRFFRAAGVALVVVSDNTSELFGRTVSLAPAPDDIDARSRFGTFSVSVLDIDRWLAGGFWAEQDLGEIDWNEHVPEREGDPDAYWTASRFYRRNVQLIWQTQEKKLDARWERLHEVLSALDSV